VVSSSVRPPIPIRLYDLSYAGRLYEQLTRFDSSLAGLDAAVAKRELDPGVDGDGRALLKWLNNWGCRQFAVAFHALAAAQIAEWWNVWQPQLPESHVDLHELDHHELEVSADAYGDLKGRPASRRGGRETVVAVGPTGAAKILFVLRRRAFPPWDDLIRARLGYAESKSGYLSFLTTSQQQARGLVQEAATRGVEAPEIGAVVGRPSSSLPKLIDEYHWVTMTRGLTVPTRTQLDQWRELESY
jgi:hypothetical protein